MPSFGIFHASSLLISGFKNSFKLINTPGSGEISDSEPTLLNLQDLNKDSFYSV